MKGTSDLVSLVHHLKMADEHAESFINGRPTAALSPTVKNVRQRIAGSFTALKTNIYMPEIVRDGINQEIKSDVFAVPALKEKIALLTPQRREALETLIDELLNDNEIEIEVQ